MRGYCTAGGGVHELRYYCGEPRPLVVIDPEDREQVERLTAAMVNEYGVDVHYDETQAALRSLIAPPRPPEPKGLGAVVEDADGRRWSRANDAGEWYSADGEEVGPHYSHVAAVRVLSEGVTPDA
jgi:hypothetical protein